MQKYGQRGPRMPQNAPQPGLFDQQEKEKVKSQTTYSNRHKRGQTRWKKSRSRYVFKLSLGRPVDDLHSGDDNFLLEYELEWELQTSTNIFNRIRLGVTKNISQWTSLFLDLMDRNRGIRKNFRLKVKKRKEPSRLEEFKQDLLSQLCMKLKKGI